MKMVTTLFPIFHINERLQKNKQFRGKVEDKIGEQTVL